VSEASDERIKRLFAQAPAVQADEGFVVQVAAQVAGRRGVLRARRNALLLLLAVAGVGLALLLAPLAPMALVPDVADSLAGLPGQVGAAAASVRGVPAAPWLGLALAAVALPLAAVAWLSRRA
jgi:hypothetical protein